MDPIGLAGGLNLYGYAYGDPINNSDPFGLCPKDAGGDGKTDVYSDCPRGSSGYWAYQSTQGNGGLLAEARGTIAACNESTACSATAVVGSIYIGSLVAAEVAATEAGVAALNLIGSNRYLRIGMRMHKGKREMRVAGKWLDAITGEEGTHWTSAKLLKKLSEWF